VDIFSLLRTIGEMSREIPEADRIHALVLEYLKKSGRHAAVRALEAEADLPVEKDNEYLFERGLLRSKLLAGDVVGAIDEVNGLFPELFDGNTELFFCLRLQALIELVRQPGYDLSAALHFAKEELNPCPTSLREEMEEVMSLLLFEDTERSPLKQILEKRERVALRLNDAILRFIGAEGAGLDHILGSAIWHDQRLRTKGTMRNVDVEEPGSRRFSDEECQKFFDHFF
jgi:hypothetical protein